MGLQLLVSPQEWPWECYIYTAFVNFLTNKKPAEKFDAADKSRLETAVNETIKWFDISQDGLEEDYKEKNWRNLDAIAM